MLVAGMRTSVGAMMKKALKNAGNIIVCLVILIGAKLVADLVCSSIPVWWAAEVLNAVLFVSLAFGIGIVYASRVLHASPLSLGVSKRPPQLKWLFLGVLLPVCISAFYLFCVPGSFQRNHPSGGTVSVVVHAVLSVGVATGVVEEFFFRGIILRTMERDWNKTVVVVVPSVVFAAVHLLNLPSWNVVEVVLLLTGGTAVGVMFSLITLQCGEIWSSSIVHGLWNTVMIGGILTIDSGGDHVASTSIFHYRLSSESVLLTGGSFGIEVGLPSIIGFTAMAIIAYSYMRKDGHANGTNETATVC